MALPKQSKFYPNGYELLTEDFVIHHTTLKSVCRETVQTFEVQDQVQGCQESTRAQSKTQKSCKEKSEKK